MRRPIALALMLLLIPAVAASAQELTSLESHRRANGSADPGTATSEADGGVTTAYADGWVRLSTPDDSFGPGGSRVIEKDPDGRVRHILQYDVKHTRRHFTTAEELPDSSIELIHFNYDENGNLTDIRVEFIGGPAAIGPAEGAPEGGSTTAPRGGGSGPGNSSPPGR